MDAPDQPETGGPEPVAERKVSRSGEFVFPIANRAYKPSGRYEVRRLPILFAVAVVVGIVAGVIQHYIHAFTLDVGAFIIAGADGRPFWTLAFGIVALVGFLFATIVSPALIGWLVGAVVQSARCRNGGISATAGVIGALVATAAYAIVRTYALDVEAFDTGIDWAKLGLVFLANIVIAPIWLDSKVSDTPFCEACEAYVKQREVAKARVEDEGPVIEALTARTFDALPSMFWAFSRKLGDTKRESEPRGDWVVVQIWECPTCLDFGMLEAETKLKWQEWKEGDRYTEGKYVDRSADRRVFSAMLTSDEIVIVKALTNDGPESIPGAAT